MCFYGWMHKILMRKNVTLYCDWIITLALEIIWQRIIWVVVLRMIMMPSCPYFIFINTSISKHVDIFFDFSFSLEYKRGLSLGELIRPFCIMLLYRYLLHYGLLLHTMSQYLFLFSLILQGLHKEGECRQLGFWAGKGANIRDLFCTAPKVLKLHGWCFPNI